MSLSKARANRNTARRLVESAKHGFARGIGFSAAVLTTSLFAAAAAMNVFSGGQTISASQINQNFLISAPEGAVVAFNLANCPDGWAPADGSNGTPDLRGKFVRGLNDFGTGVPANPLERDPDARTLAGFQGDAFQGHTHQLGSAGGGGLASTIFRGLDSGSGLVSFSGPITDGSNGAPRVADETRGRNIALIYCQRKN
ncbi:MAG: phage tail protein [Spirochaetia bacterium]|nr:phage tail protein [Spirochaetia bacterium]